MALLEMRESDLYAMYDDFLDEVHERVFICGFEYSPSLALMRIDRVAYNCGFNDWLDHEVAEGMLQEVDGKYFRCYYGGQDMFYYYPTAPGLQKVGVGSTAWGALCDSMGKENANLIIDDTEYLVYKWHKVDGENKRCADLVLRSTGETIGRFEEHV